ncbi:tetratricopeptide repeat protein [Planctomicrobium sp. SH668]|uniref:tetratricopeptide repeat protein n=1 Tax=Planctomicrobium sp. SH668 TaxID=3448126 RepID=UPI003F5B1A80
MLRNQIFLLTIACCVLSSWGITAIAQETIPPSSPLATASSGTPIAPPSPPPQDARQTAVALNYCRASFHRIRKNQSESVLIEEQEKILNNLNLGQVDDPEVIVLYTAVLDEIGQTGLAEKERVMMRTNHTTNMRRKVTWDAVAFGTDLMTAQFGNAVRTGANSWWDYRNQVFQRDMDVHKIEKTRVLSVMQRSSQFLDTFWKLARKKNIPDRWLVRGDDLDQLEFAMQEKDPEVRLRVLKRMEAFMEAYPPYWYYVARTQQELGNLPVAIEMYSKLEGLGTGYFRKDELLATAMANQAAIFDYLDDDRAIAAAQKSLDYSTDVWEANLMSARVLQRRGRIADAEDAILRNLDVQLEQSQSHIFLASLYYFSGDEKKVLAMLNDPQAVAHLPAPVLLRMATLVGVDQAPPLVVNNILASLEAFPRNGLAGDQTLVRVGYAWQLHLARVEAWQDGTRLADPTVVAGKGYHDLKFATGAADRSFPLPQGNQRIAKKDLQLVLTYPDDTIVKLSLAELADARTDRPGVTLGAMATNSMRIASISLGDDTFALRPREARAPVSPDDDSRTSRILPESLTLPISVKKILKTTEVSVESDEIEK